MDVSTMNDRSIRAWIWASLGMQLLGYVVDAVWHGLLSPGVEPTTVQDMVRHLGTVHLPLYVGAAGVLASTTAVLLRGPGRSPSGTTLAASAGALVSAASEAWHASSHLRLDTQHAPVAGTLSFIGFVVVVVAMSLSRTRRRPAGVRE